MNKNMFSYTCLTKHKSKKKLLIKVNYKFLKYYKEDL
jgi:hypothetical protein